MNTHTYDNYQLYRTNPKLSGQIKWNLVVNNDASKLTISDFQLIPISNNALNIRSIKSNLLTHSHIENLKRYYELNSEHFYNDIDYLDTHFKNDEPVKNDTFDLCPTTYNMGCKRALYKRNEKQFEFLCPLWLEKVENSIEFKFTLYSKNKTNDTIKVLSSKILTFEFENYIDGNYNMSFNEVFHNNFTNYLSDYLYKTGIKLGKNSIGTIRFIESNEFNGSTKFTNDCLRLKKNISIIDDIVLPEFNQVSSLLETDNAIISAINDNACICPQLINFNFCFNLEDIASNNVINLLSENAAAASVSIDVFVDGKLLEKRDFDSEYTYIRKSLIYDKTDSNIKDYINEKETKDINIYNVFDKSYENKLYNSSCHFSLSENDNYILNTFQGFEGITISYDENNKIVEYYNDYQYCDTPNIYIEGDPIIGDCSTRWINTKYINTWDEFYKYVQHTDEYKNEGIYSYISNSSQQFINGIKYINIPDELKDSYILGIVLTDKLLTNIITIFDCIKLYNDNAYENRVYAYEKDGVLFLLTNNEKLLTLYRINLMIKTKSASINENSLLYSFGKLIDSNIEQIKIVSINDINSVCFRYDGLIKPKFTNKLNTLSYKDLVKNEFKKYDNYTSIKTTKDVSYDNVPNVNVTKYGEYKQNSIINTNNEYSWFNTNKCFVLLPIIEFSETIDIDKYKSTTKEYNNVKIFDTNLDTAIQDIIKAKLENLYNLKNVSNEENRDSKIKYILSIYDKSINWDFDNDSSLKYKVNIKLSLK